MECFIRWGHIAGGSVGYSNRVVWWDSGGVWSAAVSAISVFTVISEKAITV